MTKNDAYCFISKVIHHRDKTQYLGACWYIKMIFININNIINPINHVPKIRLFLLINNVISVATIAANETNNQTGYTDHNLFSSLFVVRGFTDKKLTLAFHIKLSPNTKNIPNGINDNVIEKNNISAQTLLFSTLLTLEKNIIIDIATHNNIQTKWKWYQ